MLTIDCKYSPEDDKLRLYASARLDKETYERVKAAGFGWAPKQECFYAVWTPEREDLALELATSGEIGDEDTTLAERAEQRAERFEEYREKRTDDARGAEAAVARIADNIPMGQPILVSHHSERHARKDAQRIENGMRKAVKMWDTADYWSRRAAGALAAAKYKERPAVRHRRIKGLESDVRRVTKAIDESLAWAGLWTKTEKKDGTPIVFDLDRAKMIANHHHVSGVTFGGVVYASLWGALTDSKMTAEEAREIALSSGERNREYKQRWLSHYENRLAYERAMLDEAGGLVGDTAARDAGGWAVGGQVLVGRFAGGTEWATIVRVNKAHGQVVSVTAGAVRGRVYGIEEVRDYRAPTDEAKAAVAAATKKAPLCNYRLPDCVEMTTAEWKRRSSWGDGFWRVRDIAATPERGAHRHRTGIKGGGGRDSYQPTHVFLTDAKETQAPAPEAVATQAEPEAAAGIVESASAATAPLPSLRELASVPTPRAPYTPPAERARADELRQAVKAGVQMVQAEQLFPTPAPVAARMIEALKLEHGMDVLEPSAGTGALVDAVRFSAKRTAVVAMEINRDLVTNLRTRFEGTLIICTDFLTVTPAHPYDRIAMNPPFQNGSDIAHIEHAMKFLKPGGRLVALCANGPRQQAKLRDGLVQRLGGTWEPLPTGSFAEQGTGVNVAMLVVDAPEAAEEPASAPSLRLVEECADEVAPFELGVAFETGKIAPVSVVCDETNNTPEDRDAGRVNVDVSVSLPRRRVWTPNGWVTK